MGKFIHIAEHLPVNKVMDELNANPQLWGQNQVRTGYSNSPFQYAPDIWVRWRKKEQLTSAYKYHEPHWASFYPAWDLLPSLHEITFDLMRIVDAVYLGAILITRIPAGQNVAEHNDMGAWHAEYTDCKAFVTLSGSGCEFWSEDNMKVFNVGSAWSFNNLRNHKVVNTSNEDRITAIICMLSKNFNFCEEEDGIYKAREE